MEDVLKKLRKDQDGLETYEYIANNIGKCDEHMASLVENIINVDRNGQFAVSTARYLNAINKEKYADSIDALIKAAIDKDRERRYIPDFSLVPRNDASAYILLPMQDHNNGCTQTSGSHDINHQQLPGAHPGVPNSFSIYYRLLHIQSAHQEYFL